MQKSIHCLTLLFIIFLSVNIYGQKTLQGLVINQNGEELVGATVLSKINHPYLTGTVADMNGNFSVALFESDTIKISYIGYQDKLVSYEDLSFDKLIMLEKTDYDLGPVVVTAYQNPWRRNCGVLSDGLCLPSSQNRTITLDIQIEGEKWQVYPNPTQGNLMVESEYTKTGSIELLDMNGKLLQRYPAEKRKELLNLNQHPAGTYYLRHLTDDQSRFIGKVVKVD